jgi:membrane protein DedA with SNARE-associated domain
MRFLLVTILGSLPVASALAHPLTTDHTVSARVIHQFAGMHHWPVLLLAVLAIYAGVRYRQQHDPTRNRRK